MCTTQYVSPSCTPLAPTEGDCFEPFLDPLTRLKVGVAFERLVDFEVLVDLVDLVALEEEDLFEDFLAEDLDFFFFGKGVMVLSENRWTAAIDRTFP